MEEHRIERYERSTEFGDYVIIVEIDKEARRKHIKLYDEEPYPNLLCRIFDIDREPIDEMTIGWYSSIESAIKSMIFRHEFVEYQLQQLEEADPYLYIDYDAELAKRRPKPKQQQEQEQQKEPQEQAEPQLIQVHDWQNGTYAITPKGKLANTNSLANLPQYRHLKK